MPSIRINKHLRSEMYFLTLTVYRWYYIFDRHDRWKILADSLKFCQNKKAVKIYGFVFMLNHIHLLAEAPDMIGFLRDFKRYIAQSLLKNIGATEPNILKLFKTKDSKYQFWEKTNMPQLIETEKFFQQKLDYIHNNPIKKQYVTSPEHWHWSSAQHYYCHKPCPLEIADL